MPIGIKVVQLEIGKRVQARFREVDIFHNTEYIFDQIPVRENNIIGS
jgi:hypothetical protein